MIYIVTPEVCTFQLNGNHCKNGYTSDNCQGIHSINT